jgi:hypothetical protein
MHATPTAQLWTQTLAASLTALQGEPPASRPVSMLPGCTEAWAPPELLFGAAPQRALGSSAACAF